MNWSDPVEVGVIIRGCYGLAAALAVIPSGIVGALAWKFSGKAANDSTTQGVLGFVCIAFAVFTAALVITAGVQLSTNGMDALTLLISGSLPEATP